MSCKDCNNTGVYQGLDVNETCRACNGDVASHVHIEPHDNTRDGNPSISWRLSIAGQVYRAWAGEGHLRQQLLPNASAIVGRDGVATVVGAGTDIRVFLNGFRLVDLDKCRVVRRKNNDGHEALWEMYAFQDESVLRLCHPSVNHLASFDFAVGIF